MPQGLKLAADMQFAKVERYVVRLDRDCAACRLQLLPNSGDRGSHVLPGRAHFVWMLTAQQRDNSYNLPSDK